MFVVSAKPRDWRPLGDEVAVQFSSPPPPLLCVVVDDTVTAVVWELRLDIRRFVLLLLLWFRCIDMVFFSHESRTKFGSRIRPRICLGDNHTVYFEVM